MPKRSLAWVNRLIHAYDKIDPAIIWAILNNHLRPLKTEIVKKLH